MKFERLSMYKIKKIIECFAEDITATSASIILKLNRKTVNKYYNGFRQKILEQSLEEHRREFGEFELDESYFGARRIHGKRGRRAVGKTSVFGLPKEMEKFS